MEKLILPGQFIMIALAGWLNQLEQAVIDHLNEENRILKEQLGGKRPQLNDALEIPYATFGTSVFPISPGLPRLRRGQQVWFLWA